MGRGAVREVGEVREYGTKSVDTGGVTLPMECFMTLAHTLSS